MINLGNGEEKKEIKIGTSLSSNERQKLEELLCEYVDVFAWSYQDMPDLNTDIVVHKLPLRPDCKPIKQKLRRMKLKMLLKIKEEVKKQFDTGFLEVAKYPEWVANIVLVPKNDGKIKMAPEDMKKTTFVTMWGMFCYKVMPFGLKNAGATYQKTMVVLLHDMMHKEIELTFKCDPIFKLFRKRDLGEWNRECQIAFDKMKEYLTNPLVLVPPTVEKPLFLYLTVNKNSMECILGQHDETGKKEQAIYYLSKKLTEYESKYSVLEKMYCALVWTAKRLRQYMLYHTTWLVAKLDPIKYIFEKPFLSGRIARWQVILSKYDIVYVSQKLIKGSVIADFLVDRVIEDYEPMYSDGASNALGHEIGIVLVSPNGRYYLATARLDFNCTNNMTGYEALVMGLQAAIEMKADAIDVYGDSALVICQMKGEWETRDSKLVPYKTMFKIKEATDVRPFDLEVHEVSAHCLNVEEEVDGKPCGEVLYKRSRDQELLRCVDVKEANKIMRKVHEGTYGAYTNGHTLARPITRAGYYWLTLESDYINFALKCHKCQVYADRIHSPPALLHVFTVPWPFSMWGIDVIGLITPKAFNGHRFILVAIDYFTKWVEAASYVNVTQKVVCRFIQKEIICRYGLLEMVITDNASSLNGAMVKEVCAKFKIKHHNSTTYRSKMNGAVGAANKNIKKIVEKMTEVYKDWHEKLSFALHAYRTSVRTSIEATPYSLVYGTEAVLLVEVEIPSLRVLMETELEDAE
ncbi:Integrase [Theobroma cacao]|nr:Integrase [Theobroma cacao]